MKILIVEDDPLMQLGLAQALGNESQFEIMGQAEDGYGAVQQAIALRPDIVIMDIGLPGLDGIEATKQIKTAVPKIHVVVLTSHTLPNEIIAALASGADAYCIKGATLEHLIKAINAAKDGATYLDPQIARVVVENLKPAQEIDQETNIASLSEREVDVLKLIVQGKSNQEIAKDLYLSTNTIKTHVRGIMNKLSVDDRVQAAVIALRSGLV
ncbi:MAG: response regulator transcription factor [Synechocystis sp.]|nr:response regulator transcription factor [Synechocystis sp.]